MDLNELLAEAYDVLEEMAIFKILCYTQVTYNTISELQCSLKETYIEEALKVNKVELVADIDVLEDEVAETIWCYRG